MIFGYFIFFVALVISAVAEYYSIMGLTAIFAAAFWPVVIMGVALGIGKITAAVWLKLNWDRAKWTYKIYLVPAVGFLMFLTSMGIFGFLSKAHNDVGIEINNIASNVAIYDEKIKAAYDNIEANRKVLKQLDDAVDQVLERSSNEQGAMRSIRVRNSQQKERKEIANNIATEQKLIQQLTEEKSKILSEVRKVEAEVGPIKYIAAIIYGNNADTALLESAVRWVIILIVLVFDPLALCLMLAAQQSIRWAKEDKIKNLQIQVEKVNGNTTISSTSIKDDATLDVTGITTSNSKSIISTESTVVFPDILSTEEIADYVDKIQDIPESNCNDQNVINFTNIDITSKVSEDTPHESKTLNQLTESMPMEQEQLVPIAIDTNDFVLPPPPPEAVAPKAKEVIQVPETIDRSAPKTLTHELKADNDSITISNNFKAHFGIAFPATPIKGELFLRVDYLPSKLFKFNGSKWIEVDKSLTDSYVYNTEYIKFMIKEIDAGRLDPDDLNQSERDQIAEFLAKDEQTHNPT